MVRSWKLTVLTGIGYLFLAACGQPEATVTAVLPAHTSSPVTIPGQNPVPIPTVISTRTAVVSTPEPTSQAVSETPTPLPTATTSLWPSILVDQMDFETELTFEMVNQIGGEITAVDIIDNTAYLGIGPRLVILDVSNSTSPQLIGQSDILSGVVQDFVLVGNFAYVATGQNGFWIIDVSNPFSPQVVSFKSQTSEAQQIKYQDDHLFVLGMKEGEALENELVIYSLTEPENITERSRLSLPFRFFYGDMILDDEFIFLADNYSSQLYIVDTTQLEQPLLVTTISIVKNAVKTLSNKTLYILANGDLQILDVSDTQHTVAIAQVDNLIEDYWQIEKMVVRKDLLFISAWYCDQTPCGATLFVFDISQPGQTEQITSIDIDGGLIDIRLINDKVYVTTSSLLLITQSPEWHQLGRFQDYGVYSAFDQLAIADERLYAVNSLGRGISIFSLEQPTQPVRVGLYSGAFDEVAAGDNQIYPSARWQEGLHQVDVRVPGLPRQTSILGEDASVDGPPVLEDGRLYALLNGHLGILDVTNPDGMLLLNDLDVNTQEYGPFRYISVSDNIVYALGHQGIHLLDTGTPAAIVEIGFIPEEDDMCALTAREGYVFVYSAASYCSQNNTEGGRLTIYDASNPTAIHKVGGLEIVAPVETMLLKDDYLYLVNGDLVLVDVSQLDSPQIIGFFPTPGKAYAAAIFDGLIYVADGAGGILVLRLME